MNKRTLTAIIAAALFAASAAGYALAQKGAGHGGMNHADCPLMSKGENSKSQEDAHHAALDERGERAMGFSQTATVHHFLLTPDGGVIQVEVRDASDSANRDQIRQHLSHVARAFSKGDFNTPVLVHARVPPGADAMRRLKSEITYTYEETESGARVRISTKNADALAAVRDFLRFQIEDHQTGDPLN